MYQLTDKIGLYTLSRLTPLWPSSGSRVGEAQKQSQHSEFVYFFMFQMMVPLERVRGIIFLCFDVACAPAGSVQALFCGFLICRTRWESNFVIALWFNLPSYSYSHKTWGEMCMGLSADFRTLGSYQLFLCFTFSSRCWLGKIWTAVLIQLLWDPISNWWFHHYAMKIASVKQFSENYNAFSTVLQDNFFPISLFVVDQIEDIFTLQQNYLENCY